MSDLCLENKIKAIAAMHTFLEALGLDLESPDLKDTPKRITNMYIDFFRGLPGTIGEKTPPQLTTFPNIEEYNEMVMLTDIQYVSICSHHFLPFVGTATIAYVPKDKLIGISKLARLLDYYAARPQLQERLAKQVADGIQQLLEPAGVAVYIKGSHGCIACRGANKPTSQMITTIMTGVFHDSNGRWRDEFLQTVQHS
jgi:GTP cyclohydrolase I